jgi:hypothetical protein
VTTTTTHLLARASHDRARAIFDEAQRFDDDALRDHVATVYRELLRYEYEHPEISNDEEASVGVTELRDVAIYTDKPLEWFFDRLIADR